MCDALRGMLTGFVLRLRGTHSRGWDVQNLSQVNGSFWPILLKKSALVASTEKLAPEIEILKFSRGLCGLSFHVATYRKGVFISHYWDSSGKATFLTESADFCRSCPRIVLVKSDANDWSGRMQIGGQVRALTPLSNDRRYFCSMAG